MSNSREANSYGVRGAAVGVVGLGIPKERYSPLSHNPPAPQRVGSTDAFKCSSRDHTGALLPYWASKE